MSVVYQNQSQGGNARLFPRHREPLCSDYHGDVYPCGVVMVFMVVILVLFMVVILVILTGFRETHRDSRAVCVSLVLWCVIWSCEDNSG